MKSGHAVLAVILLALACTAQAEDELSIVTDECSGERSTITTDTELKLLCAGDFKLAGVRIVTTKKVVFQGQHSLTLAGDITVKAPVLEVIAQDEVLLTGRLQVPDAPLLVNAAGGAVMIASTAMMDANSVVMNTSGAGLQRIEGQDGVITNQALRGAGAVALANTPVEAAGPVKSASPTDGKVVEAPAAGALQSNGGGGGGAMSWLELGALALMALVALTKPAAWRPRR